jgi:hypothetical protein
VFFTGYNYNNKANEEEMGRAYSMLGAKMNEYRILVGKPEGKRLLGRPRRKTENNINVTCRPFAEQQLDKHIPAETDSV